MNLLSIKKPTAFLIGINGVRRCEKTTFVLEIMNNLKTQQEVMELKLIGSQTFSSKENLEVCKINLISKIQEIDLSTKKKNKLTKLVKNCNDWLSFFISLEKTIKSIQENSPNCKFILFLDEKSFSVGLVKKIILSNIFKLLGILF